ncbi:MAG: FAD-dependent oxidoreductase [Candidatus Methanofastidiosia archaeon]|jgi:glycerol-3-phosphate dehydrogenase
MITDQKIEQKIKSHIQKKGYPISVSVDNGIVHLTGEVKTWDTAIAIGYYTTNQKGVKGIINDVTTPEKPKKPQLSHKKILTYDIPKSADVIIIGAGVIGCFIARELSKYNLDVTVIEKEPDVACGATKANNSQIHTGIGEKSGTLKKKLCAESWPVYPDIAQQLHVPYKKNGLLIVITKDTLPAWVPSFISIPLSKYLIPFIVKRKGKHVGDNPKIINKKELQKIEPNITQRAVSAVLLPGYGMICPYKLTIALAENALHNGVTFLLETEVTDIEVVDNTVKSVITDRGKIKTRYIVNAAGVYADTISKMAGIQEYTIHPRKGSIILFDKKLHGFITHQITELTLPQDPHTKGGGILETVDGNMLWGPTAVEVSHKEDTSVTPEEIDILHKYHSIIPEFPKEVITYFAGVRAPTYTEDFVIKASKIKNFVHAGGIQSPGLTAAPKIAEMVVTLLHEQGLPLKEDAFEPERMSPPVFRELSIKEKQQLIDENPLYGNVVCRCEQVTEAEVVNAIHGVLPAVTMDAVKRRTRAGMGRCQGGFCGPRVAEILARELDIPLEEVTKKGTGSYVITEKTKVVK